MTFTDTRTADLKRILDRRRRDVQASARWASAGRTCTSCSRRARALPPPNACVRTSCSCCRPGRRPRSPRSARACRRGWSAPTRSILQTLRIRCKSGASASTCATSSSVNRARTRFASSGAARPLRLAETRLAASRSVRAPAAQLERGGRAVRHGTASIRRSRQPAPPWHGTSGFDASASVDRRRDACARAERIGQRGSMPSPP